MPIYGNQPKIKNKTKQKLSKLSLGKTRLLDLDVVLNSWKSQELEGLIQSIPKSLERLPITLKSLEPSSRNVMFLYRNLGWSDTLIHFSSTNLLEHFWQILKKKQGPQPHNPLFLLQPLSSVCLDC